MEIDREVEFGIIAPGDPDEGVPPILVKQMARERCGCSIIVGMRCTPEIMARAGRLGKEMRLGEDVDPEEKESLYQDALAIAFGPCENDEHSEIMRRAMLAFHDSLDAPQERDAIDVAVDFWDLERGVPA